MDMSLAPDDPARLFIKSRFQEGGMLIKRIFEPFPTRDTPSLLNVNQLLKEEKVHV